MLYWCILFATWMALPASYRVQTFHTPILVLPFIVKRGVDLLGSCEISPEGFIQLSEEASSGVRLAVVVNIVSVSVIAQSTGA